VLAVAFVDDLIAVLRGRTTSYATAEAERATEMPTFER